MKAIQQLVLAAVVCLVAVPRPVSAQGLVWYDAERQALAFDAYGDGRTGMTTSIELDFDGDHDAAGTVGRSSWHNQYGDVTQPGLYEREVFISPTGWTSITTWYGWGEKLGSYAAVSGYLTDVTELWSFPGVPAENRFHYFTDLWDVAAGRTVIYVRPLDAANLPVPVEPGRFAQAWYRVGGGEWLPIAIVGDVTPPPPPPPPPAPEVASMQVSPRTLNLKSKGQTVTVKLALPPGRTAESVDLDSLRLGLASEERDAAGKVLRAFRHSSGPLAIAWDGGLIVKFSRADLQGIVLPGEASLTLSGAFLDGKTFEADATISVIQ